MPDQIPPNQTPPAQTTITPDSLNALQGDNFKSLLPEEYRSKGYIKDVNSFPELLKKFDGAQSLLGQRVEPAADAPEDTWKAYHKKTAPATAEEYVIPAIEGLSEEQVKGLSKNQSLRGVFHEAGVSQFQAKILLKGLLTETMKADKSVSAKRDAEFAELTKEVFGEDKTTALTNGKAYLTTYMSDKAKALLDTLDAKSAAVVFSAVNGMAKKLGEDPFKGGNAAPSNTSGSKENLIKQMQEIQKDPSWTDPFKDRVKHAELNQKMNGIREALKKFS